jgi:hypothetical protein
MFAIYWRKNHQATEWRLLHTFLNSLAVEEACIADATVLGSMHPQAKFALIRDIELTRRSEFPGRLESLEGKDVIREFAAVSMEVSDGGKTLDTR